MKIRGHRIELGEIEYHLNKHFAGHPVAVESIKPFDSQGVKRLIAFVAIKNDATNISSGNLGPGFPILPVHPSYEWHEQWSNFRSHTILPSFMVPDYAMSLDNLPKMASQKIDRKALREYVSQMTLVQLRAHSTHYKEPEYLRTDVLSVTEQTLQQMWAKVLNIEEKDIKPHHSFLSLGGDSIKAITLVRNAQANNIQCFLSDLLSARNLSDMAASIDTDRSVVPGTSYSSFSSLDLESNELEHFLKTAIASNIPYQLADIEDVIEGSDFQADCALGIAGESLHVFDFGGVDACRLERACKELLAETAVLRTVFTAHQRHFYQVILRPAAYPFSFKNYRCNSSDFIERLTRQLHTMIIRRPWKLGTANVRFIYLNCSDNKGEGSRLLLQASHAYYDGTSLQRLQERLVSLYEGIRTDPLVPHFPEFMNESLKTRQNAEDYWRKVLAGSSNTYLFGRPRYAPYLIKPSGYATRDVPNPAMKKSGFSNSVLVLALWALLLGELTNTTDVVFADFRRCRNLPIRGIEDMIGCCAGNVPVRLNTSSSTVRQLLEKATDQQLSSAPHEAMGWHKIVERCTDWPKSTRLSTSVINHAMEEKGFVKAAGTCWKTWTLDVYDPPGCKLLFQWD